MFDSEHIWPVTVKAKGLSGNRDKGIPPGAYRLCLTNTDVSLIRLYSDKPEVVLPVSIFTRSIFKTWIIYLNSFSLKSFGVQCSAYVSFTTLLVQLYVGLMSAIQRAAMLCGWVVKAGMVRVWWQVKLCEP